MCLWSESQNTVYSASPTSFLIIMPDQGTVQCVSDSVLMALFPHGPDRVGANAQGQVESCGCGRLRRRTACLFTSSQSRRCSLTTVYRGAASEIATVPAVPTGVGAAWVNTTQYFWPKNKLTVSRVQSPSPNGINFLIFYIQAKKINYLIEIIIEIIYTITAVKLCDN